MKILYKCEKCGYETDRLLNYKRHEQRKTPCYTKIEDNVDKIVVPQMSMLYPQMSMLYPQMSMLYPQMSMLYPQMSMMYLNVTVLYNVIDVIKFFQEKIS